MADINNDLLQEENEKPIDWKAMVMEYLIYWPYILIFLLLCMTGAYFYVRHLQPQYIVNATLLIKQNNKSQGGAMTAMQDMGMISMANSIDNEMEILRSRTLIKKVVNTLGLNISYHEKQTLRYNRCLYKASPVNVWMAPEEAERLAGGISLEMEPLAGGKLGVKATYYHAGKEVKETKTFDKLPALMITPVGTVSFTPSADSALVASAAGRRIYARISQPTATALSCQARLAAAPKTRSGGIAVINFTDISVPRAADFINTLVALYNSDANDDKNEVANRTAEFINTRIEIINKELSTTESEMAEYKRKAGIIDISSNATLALQGSSEYERRQVENETQLQLVRLLRQYIEDPANQFEIIPSNAGPSDEGLNTVIAQYNEMLVERKRLLRTSNDKNPSVISLNLSIEATRQNVATTVASVEKKLLFTRSGLEAEARKYETRLSDAPIREKEYISISRQQEIKANLYLMLLEKREENAMTLAATANNGRIIEEPMLMGVTGAKGSQFYLMAFVLGLGLPVGCIFLARMFRFKIEGRADVERITSLPIIGDVPTVAEDLLKEGAIVIRENQNELMEEVYRNVRTNVQYILGSKGKVILVTSTMPKEGKSFTAGNLAASFAFMGKRTLVMGMDIRKPGLNRVFNLSRKQEGITSYLAQPDTTDLLSLCTKSDISDYLYIITVGTIPPNPTELAASEALDRAMEILRQHFDIIIMDTAPIGIVTDTQLMARVADMSIFVCRADYTHKSDFHLINELHADKKLPRLCTLINGIDMDKRHNGFYYGYGKYGRYGKYGYGKRYGYGYGYGYGK